MGTIIDFIKLRRGNDVKKIFKYSTGKGTMNNIIFNNINQIIYNLLCEGYTFT